MKNRLIILILILLSCITLVNATMVERPLNLSIANCYNVSIDVDLNNGKETDLRFNGCNKVNNYHFTCNCYNSENKNFSIIMQTDNTIVRDLREYDIKIKATYFNFNTKSITIPVTDGGDYYELNTANWKYLGINNKTETRIVEKIVYIQNTTYVEIPVETKVYVDRNITQIEYVNITINNTEYFENTTQIIELSKKNKEYIFYNMLSILICIICIISLIYNFRDKK